MLAVVAFGFWDGREWAVYGLAVVITAMLLSCIRNEWDLITGSLPGRTGWSRSTGSERRGPGYRDRPGCFPPAAPLRWIFGLPRGGPLAGPRAGAPSRRFWRAFSRGPEADGSMVMLSSPAASSAAAVRSSASANLPAIGRGIWTKVSLGPMRIAP